LLSTRLGVVVVVVVVRWAPAASRCAATRLAASAPRQHLVPQVDEFCYITDNTYTREDMLQMESLVLDTLQFELTAATSKAFLRRFLQAAHADSTLEYLAAYLCELALVDYEMLRFPASKVAASAVLLSLYTLQRHPWTPTLAHYTQYPASQLADCARRLWVLFRSARLPSALPAVRDKYSAPRFKCVSKLMHPHELPGHIFSD